MRLLEEHQTTDEEQLKELSAAWSRLFKPGDVILLTGDLGSGKTTLVQHLCRNWTVRESVTSPTFTLMQHYSGAYPVVHLDLYRLENDQALHELGWEEWLYGDTVAFVEWPERLEPYLRGYYKIDIRRQGTQRVYRLYRKDAA